MDLATFFSLLLLILGFGFVIFWHELGHFLAAKWAGVKVEQFAVGFGQALLCWRKGIGVTVGTSAPRVQTALVAAREKGDIGTDEELLERQGIGETEYRLNWIPLGGYVKMLGQDDTDPNNQSIHPRAYNNKPIGQRMVIISAGVMMNVILAAILFVALFLYGFRTPAPVVGYALAGSPADRAGIEPGDRVLRFDGATMHDFSKIRIATALAHPTEPTRLDIRKADGTEKTITIVPQPEAAAAGGFLQIGIGPAALLQIADGLEEVEGIEAFGPLADGSIKSGDRIVAVNDQALQEEAPNSTSDANWAAYDRAVQASGGRPVVLSLRGVDGATRQATVKPAFQPAFGGGPILFAGMEPRVSIAYIQKDSAAHGKLQPGDVITRVSADTPSRDAIDHPNRQQFLKTVETASAAGTSISVDVDRNGEKLAFPQLPLNVKIESMVGFDRRGLGVGLEIDTESAVIAAVAPESSAAKAGLRSGMRIVSINGTPVRTWFDVHAALKSAGSAAARVQVATSGGEETITLQPTTAEAEMLAGQRYALALPLKERTELRQTNNPLTAMAWGVGETRDLIVQFYITLKRMLVQQSISARNLSGPVGIIDAGVKIASRGNDWLLWYLAIISANLAVVNFLPLPIVDGGHFVFLLIEKIRGRPLSPGIMAATQLVGIALLLSLFLFVTYNDLLRML